MTERELKNLNRADLLEMLLAVSKENEELKMQLQDAQDELTNRQILLKNVGSIAEASLQLNGVFEAAQKAGEHYVENIQMIVTQYKNRCAKMEENTKKKRDKMLGETRKQCDKMLEETRKQCDGIWEELYEKIKEASGYDFDMRCLLNERFHIEE